MLRQTVLLYHTRMGLLQNKQQTPHYKFHFVEPLYL